MEVLDEVAASGGIDAGGTDDGEDLFAEAQEVCADGWLEGGEGEAAVFEGEYSGLGEEFGEAGEVSGVDGEEFADVVWRHAPSVGVGGMVALEEVGEGIDAFWDTAGESESGGAEVGDARLGFGGADELGGGGLGTLGESGEFVGGEDDIWAGEEFAEEEIAIGGGVGGEEEAVEEGFGDFADFLRAGGEDDSAAECDGGRDTAEDEAVAGGDGEGFGEYDVRDGFLAWRESIGVEQFEGGLDGAGAGVEEADETAFEDMVIGGVLEGGENFGCGAIDSRGGDGHAAGDLPRFDIAEVDGAAAIGEGGRGIVFVGLDGADGELRA